MTSRRTHMGTSPFPNVNLGGGVTPTLLNDVYSFGQFWIPAGSLTPSESIPMVIETYEGSVGPKPTFTVAKFAQAVAQEGNFTWSFKLDFVKAPAINLKMAPIWFAKTTAANPNAGVKFEGYCNNLLLGSSINAGMSGGNSMFRDVPATAFDLAGGDSSDEENTIPLTLTGDTLSTTKTNICNLMIERHGDESQDTFLDDVFLLGVMVQFQCDFNNIGEWST